MFAANALEAFTEPFSAGSTMYMLFSLLLFSLLLLLELLVLYLLLFFYFLPVKIPSGTTVPLKAPLICSSS